ncbi:hypothetical protein L596_023607 [Steinernema carpocapsae]|uniref:Uncharacterized protein n=1 Tax=Steinernema carpocapsae TaxID=34508 RepID=A0A4U5ME78_STECR|nr:hypothetical protein L596_023607 [Steinernema carpocapsae]
MIHSDVVHGDWKGAGRSDESDFDPTSRRRRFLVRRSEWCRRSCSRELSMDTIATHTTWTSLKRAVIAQLERGTPKGF